MNLPVTVDASVFVSAFTPGEPAHAESKTRMRDIRKSGTPIIVPMLVIPEIAAAFARGQGKPGLGLAFAEEVASLPMLTLVSMDKNLAMLAAETAATYKLRGSDAVYAAVALRFGTQLVTLDREQLERLAPALPVSAP
jgi:predicted nucleic acid-binding protein